MLCRTGRGGCTPQKRQAPVIQQRRNNGTSAILSRVAQHFRQHPLRPTTQTNSYILGFNSKKEEKEVEQEPTEKVVELFVPPGEKKRKHTKTKNPASSLSVPLPQAELPGLASESAEDIKPQITKLENGLVVATQETGSQMSALAMFVFAGPRFEGEDNYGATALLERLAFKSTEVRKASEMFDQLDYMGAQVTTTSSRDMLIYSSEVLREHVPKILGLTAESIFHNKYDKKDIDDQLKSMEFDYESFLQTADQFIPAVLHETAYQSDLFGRPLLIDPKILKERTPEQLQDHIRDHYVGSNIIFSAAGVDHEEFVKAVRANFGKLPQFGPSKLSKNLITKPKYTGGEVKLALEDLEDLDAGDRSRIAIGFECPGSASDDFVTLYTTQILLGGGSSFSSGGPGKGIFSRLYTQALNKYGWIDHMEGVAQTYMDTGLFGIYASVDHGFMYKGLEVAVDQLTSLARKIDSVELARARNMLKTSMFINLESRHILADDLGRQLTLFGKRYSPHELVEMIDKVSATDIQNLTRRILSSAPSVVYLGSKKEIEELPKYDQLIKHFKRIM